MHLERVTAPAGQIVTLAEAKAHCRVDGSEDDAQLQSMILAAQSALDGDGGSLGRALLTQTWRLVLPRFATHLQIPLPPLRTIDAIHYYDRATVLQVLPVDDFYVSRSEPAVLIARGPLPDTAARPDAVEIEFTAGYGAPGDVPAPIRHAILQRVAALYENRESALYGTGSFQHVPGGDEFLEPFRVRAF